jgi:hypothetical protein
VLTINQESNQINVQAVGVIPSNTYHILASTNLIQWSEIGTVEAAADGSISFFDDAGLPARFYRVFSP